LKRVFLSILIITIMLTGCSNKISQEEYDNLQFELAEIGTNYDNVKKEYDKVNLDYEDQKSDMDKLNADFNQTKEEYKALSNLYDDIVKRYDDLYEEGSDSLIVDAWGTTAFGDETECKKLNKNTVQFIVKLNEVSHDSISNFYNQLTENLTNLSLVTSVDETEYVYIKAIDANGLPVMEYFLNGAESGGDAMVSLNYYDTVTETFNKMVK